MERSQMTPMNPDDAFASVRALRHLADRIEESAVADAMRDGWTWADVAEALGVTRQAAHKKFAKRLTEEA